MKPIFHKSLIFAMVSLSLSACGGGGDDTSNSSTTPTSTVPTPVATVEKINGIEVPPVPPVDLNNATVTGVDTDKNSIRDDVDRLIAISAETPQKRTSYVEVATAAQKLLSETDETKLKEWNHAIGCADLGLSSSESPVLHYAIFNTKERRAIYAKSQPVGGLIEGKAEADEYMEKCVSSVKPFVSEE